MLILTLKTDQAEAELTLHQVDPLTDPAAEPVAHETWTAHRQLSETIHTKIEALLKQQNQTWADLDGLVCFKGPGSFTGLRIGLSVANALAYGLGIPIVSTQDHGWRAAGIRRLLDGENEVTAKPEYGGEIHITQPRK